jgi:putative PIN family toxin of toxin-antitoxin system
VRTVLDSSVLGATLVTPNPASAPRIILAAAAVGAVRLVVTDALEEEYRRAVEYRQVIRYSAKVIRQAFVSAVVAVADRVLAGEATGLVARDPADDMVLAAAIGGRADWVVSLDRHLIHLAAVGRVRILRPGDFLVELRRRTG